jgi:hypothetical protein
LPDTMERKSRLVTLVYQVLGTLELPAVDASEGEMLVALATAFHRKAQITVEAELLDAARQAHQHLIVEATAWEPHQDQPVVVTLLAGQTPRLGPRALVNAAPWRRPKVALSRSGVLRPLSGSV